MTASPAATSEMDQLDQLEGQGLRWLFGPQRPGAQILPPVPGAPAIVH